jgi:hypothetical protein
VPIIEIPFHIPRPGPGPVNIPWLLQDATLVASLKEAANQAIDEGVRAALIGGIDAAIGAMQAVAGDHVEIREGTAGGSPTGGGPHGPGGE